MYRKVLTFWFGNYSEETAVPANELKWFRRSDAFDQAIKDQFLPLWSEMATGGLKEWENDLHSRLALILLIDQFSRNLFRNDARSFAHDARARNLTLLTLQEKKDQGLLPFQRTFLYLPLEHSEDLQDQNLSVSCFKKLAESVPTALRASFEENLKYAEIHRDIILRFGRFPHRNAVLNRQSTEQEIEFLKDRLSFY